MDSWTWRSQIVARRTSAYYWERGTESCSRQSTIRSAHNQIAVGDFNGDGKSDLAVASTAGNAVNILLGNGDSTFMPAANYPAGVAPLLIAVGDFNGDGVVDIAAPNRDNSTVSILLGNGDGTFQTPKAYSVGQSPEQIALGDFNADGLTRILTSIASACCWARAVATLPRPSLTESAQSLTRSSLPTLTGMEFQIWLLVMREIITSACSWVKATNFSSGDKLRGWQRASAHGGRTVQRHWSHRSRGPGLHEQRRKHIVRRRDCLRSSHQQISHRELLAGPNRGCILGISDARCFRVRMA